MASGHDGDVLSDLHVSLRQTSRSPPAVAVTVTNGGAGPLTVLAWDSPLDPLALQLGLVRITPEGAPAPLDLPAVRAGRRLPPGEGSLVSLAPGEGRENHVVLAGPAVPPGAVGGGRGGRARVEVGGRWSRVWPGPREELTEAQIADLGGADGSAVSGEVEAVGIEIETE